MRNKTAFPPLLQRSVADQQCFIYQRGEERRVDGGNGTSWRCRPGGCGGNSPALVVARDGDLQISGAIRGETAHQREGRMKENSSGPPWFDHFLWAPKKPFPCDLIPIKQKEVMWKKKTQFATLVHTSKLGLGCFFIQNIKQAGENPWNFFSLSLVFLLFKVVILPHRIQCSVMKWGINMNSSCWAVCATPQNVHCDWFGFDWTCIFTVTAFPFSPLSEMTRNCRRLTP